ncbi:MAG: cell division protein ZapA [Alphaproteobacteria bacterium]|nr:cell division protein ZapA [Alphaproteobacteria bacterium]
MADVNLNIHGKNYSVACDAGQERRVAELGKYVDARLREIAAAGAASNEPHLLVLTSLVLADEIYELRDMVAELRNRTPKVVHEQVETAQRVSEEEELEILAAIEQLASRIDTVAERLQKI